MIRPSAISSSAMVFHQPRSVRKTVTWREFIRSHWDVFVATGFFNDAIWNWFGQIITFLLNLIYFSRGTVYAVGTILHQQIQGIRFFGRWTLDVRARMNSWSPWGRQFSHSAAIRWREGNQRPTVSEVTTHDDRVRIPQLRAKVVPIPSGNACQIRDGPRQHRQQPDELLITTKCKAA